MSGEGRKRKIGWQTKKANGFEKKQKVSKKAKKADNENDNDNDNENENDNDKIRATSFSEKTECVYL